MSEDNEREYDNYDDREEKRGYGYYEDDAEHRDTLPGEEKHHEHHVGKKSSNKGLVAVIIVMAIVIIGLVAFIVYDKAFNNNSVNSESKVEPTTTTTNSNEEEKDSDVSDVENISELDTTKCINASDLIYEHFDDDDGLPDVKLSVDDNQKEVSVTINWDDISKNNDTIVTSGAKTYTVTGFTKKVKKAFNGITGQTIDGARLFFLMDDGTVEFTNMFKYVGPDYKLDANTDGDGKYKTQGAISGVSDVVAFYNMQAHEKEVGGGYATTVAAKADGSFYNLATALKEND